MLQEADRPTQREVGTSDVLLIKEIFWTIQGEGPFSGQPAVFIRAGHCNLSCIWCDSLYYDGLTSMTVAEVFDEVARLMPEELYRSSRPPLVVITGGEPFIQRGLPVLLNMLIAHHTVQIETAGTRYFAQVPLDWDPDRLFTQSDNPPILVVSPKTPKIHPQIRAHAKYFKYVVQAGDADEIDGLPTADTQPHKPGHKHPGPLAKPGVELPRTDIFLSPMDEGDPEKNKANQDHAVEMCMKYGYRLSLQTHKLLGLP